MLRWCFGDQIRHAFVEWPIDDHSNRAVIRIVRGNKEDCAAKVRIEHIRVRDQERPGETARFFRTQITHVKLERASSGSATVRRVFAQPAPNAGPSKIDSLRVESFVALGSSEGLYIYRN